MKQLSLYPTDITPGVLLDAEKNLLKFWGESRPEDARTFYDPIVKWIDDYKKVVYYISTEGKQVVLITIECHFEYYNSASIKYVHDILKKMEDFEDMNNVKLFIRWIYDKGDIDMFEEGKELQTMFKTDFVFVEAK